MPWLPKTRTRKVQNKDYKKPVHEFLRELVFAEQRYICFYCRDKLTVELHHLDGDTKNTHRDNVVGVCEDCHRKCHGKGYW